MSSTSPVIIWFRQDLRRTDNPALTAAADSGYPVLPIYILDDGNAAPYFRIFNPVTQGQKFDPVSRRARSS